MSQPAKHNYLSNRELLQEIHLSKTSYCEYSQPHYHYPDAIVDCIDPAKVDQYLSQGLSVEEISQRITETACAHILKPATRKQALAARLRRESDLSYRSAVAQHEAGELEQKPKQAQHQIQLTELQLPTPLVYRVYTYEHIPLDPDRRRTPRKLSEHYVKLNFIPFKHYIINSDGAVVEVGRSHSLQGEFSQTHGALTDQLARMCMLLVQRYSQRANWRGYCVDEQTQALTQRGWLSGDQIQQSDMVLSCNSDGALVWSPIHHLYRDHYQGLMHYVSNKQGLNMLVTPEHKLVTGDGLRPMELIRENDRVVLMGTAESGSACKVYSDSMVELAGWVVTEGNYEKDKNHNVKCVRIWQNPGAHADRIRNCLQELNFEFTETKRKSTLCFSIFKKCSQQIVEILPEKNLSMEFLLNLTVSQRQLLFDTMIAGDGWKRGNQSSFAQKCPQRVDLFQALTTLLGRRSTAHLNDIVSFGKPTQCHVINVFSERKNNTNGSCLDFNGGKRTKGKKLGKQHHPNVPTVPYDGNVWCVHTDHGSFVVRRNGNTYLTGNSYVEEMVGQSLLQLSSMALQFDESKSSNPFSYYTQAIQNSFTRVLNTEKKVQRARDEILINRGQTPSFGRQIEHEEQQRAQREAAEDTDDQG